MKSITTTIAVALAVLLSTNAFAVQRHGDILCKKDPRYFCYKVKSGDTWEKLFPNEGKRDIVRRVNRYNMRLRTGMNIAVPRDIATADVISVAPFDRKIPAIGERQIIVSLKKLAWGAYDEDGDLVFWGPVSGGKGYCSDIDLVCRTVTGQFRVTGKQYAGCTSGAFPISSNGGAPMPFCMHFHKGFALHGSYEVPGYNASHGCVRMFINDARWLNERFATVGTRVVIERYE